MILKKVNDLTRKPANKFDDAFSAITGSQFGSPIDDNASSGGFENNYESKFPPRLPIKQANRLQARKIILQKQNSTMSDKLDGGESGFMSSRTFKPPARKEIKRRENILSRPLGDGSQPKPLNLIVRDL